MNYIFSKNKISTKRSILIIALFFSVLDGFSQGSRYKTCNITNNSDEALTGKVKDFNSVTISKGFFVLLSGVETLIEPETYNSFSVEDDFFESFRIDNKKVFLKLEVNGRNRLYVHNYVVEITNDEAMIDETIYTEYYLMQNQEMIKLDTTNFKSQLKSLFPDIILDEEMTYYDIPLVIKKS